MNQRRMNQNSRLRDYDILVDWLVLKIDGISTGLKTERDACYGWLLVLASGFSRLRKRGTLLEQIWSVRVWSSSNQDRWEEGWGNPFSCHVSEVVILDLIPRVRCFSACKQMRSYSLRLGWGSLRSTFMHPSKFIRWSQCNQAPI